MDEASTSKEDDSIHLLVADGSPSLKSTWKPLQSSFQPYSPPPSGVTAKKSRNLRVVVGKPLVVRLTKDIVETYQICNPDFKYCESLKPKRFLTNPSAGVLNDGLDNANSDLILTVNSALINLGSKQRYIVKDILGQGTFGQVAKCWVSETNSYVAVKIIKNQPAYYQQALVEVSILTALNQKFDPEDKHHIVRVLDYFVYQHHLCISFEMLGANLYELIRVNQFRGLSLNIVQLFSKQILSALVIMKEAGIIHCDLKPENILLSPSYSPAEIKVIDFGSACMEDRTVYSYIQSRYYRSPEVLLGYPYTTTIDMWSFGCIVAELFLGLPLFPGASEFDLIKRMIEILGGQPPDHILRSAKNTSKFFKHVGNIHHLDDDEACRGWHGAYQILSDEEYEARELKKPMLGKRYFSYVKLEDIIANYPHRKNMTEDEISNENLTRLALIDFLRGLVEFDPAKRWSPVQAVSHPFVTGQPFTCPYRPPPETPRIPVCQAVTVNHNPGAGHWLVAGLSPQVSNMNQAPPQNSPHFQVAFSYASSYGSIGSHGSCNDSAGLGSSYGSYGDNSNLHAYYSPIGPSGLSIQAPGGGSILGSSPDARWRIPQRPHGNGLGVSPSTGTFRPMSLGASPSQFTPPSSQHQVSAGSPGMYGPTSPARGSVHGSPLGKAAAVGQYNRRRSLGYPGNYCMPFQENSPSQHWQAHHSDGIGSSQPEGHSRGHIGSPRSAQLASNNPCWRPQRGGHGFSLGFASGSHQNPPVSFAPTSHATTLPSSEASYDKPEASSSPPDPWHWDPNYSDEQLLQDDTFEVTSLSTGFSTGMHLSHASSPANLTSGIARLNRGCNQGQTSSSCSSTNHRTNGPVQAYTHVESSPPSAHDMQAGYSRHIPKMSHQSRLGQQPLQQQRFSHPSQTTHVRNERVPPKIQTTPSSCTITGPRSPVKSSFTNGMQWGPRATHPVTTVLPANHGRKDYGRIS